MKMQFSFRSVFLTKYYYAIITVLNGGHWSC
jgi:hypothetical protein